MGWGGMGWDGVGWDGMGWDGMSNILGKDSSSVTIWIVVDELYGVIKCGSFETHENWSKDLRGGCQSDANTNTNTNTNT